MKEIEEFLKYADLFETYRYLLSDKQRIYLEAFLEEDNSFAEIATAMNISRQAVFDNIRKACKKLEYYEENLKILENKKKYIYNLKFLKNNFDKKVLDKIIEEIEGS